MMVWDYHISYQHLLPEICMDLNSRLLRCKKQNAPSKFVSLLGRFYKIISAVHSRHPETTPSFEGAAWVMLHVRQDGISPWMESAT